MVKICFLIPIKRGENYENKDEFFSGNYSYSIGLWR